MQAVAADGSDQRARYLAVLALARSGATQRAVEQFQALGLDGERGPDLPDDLAEDIGGLWARLAKDAALVASGTARQAQAAVAASRYEATYRDLGRAFACVNAATMWRLAGEVDRSRLLAQDAVGLVTAPGTDADYWALATEAEARILLDDQEGARAALSRAGALESAVGDRASTRRQLALVCEISGADHDLVDVLRIPRVVHYTGHMVAAPSGAGAPAPGGAARIGAEVASLVESREVGFGYGALACGADLIIAEALLAAGAELHVVLPFAAEDFVRASVLPGGDEWSARFDACLAAATSVTIVTDRGEADTPVLFAHGSEVAMGRAILRASYLGADVEQIAVWDGQPARGGAGTSVDVHRWQAGSRRTHVVPVDRALGGGAPVIEPEPSVGPPRVVRALLFADVRGFSRLSEDQIPAFVDVVLRRFATVLGRFDAHIQFRNTWGDGLYVVFDDVVTAARGALALQQAMDELDFAAAGLPADLALRIGAHAGPVFQDIDPVTERLGFFGVEVTRTARIEPGTPVGDVYVTDAFASLVALADAADLTCQYVGPLPTAKGFGTLPLYALRRGMTPET